ncbi:translation initiation factor IF-5A [Candidatus Woesearchaeota archaeon]|nr:translation initiation factor IF-5A [Candidatus Woesearchaeota archaeon]
METEGETKKADAGSMKSGSFMVIDGVACKVVDNQISRPGKHGHAKCRITGVGLLDGKKRVVVMPGHDNVDVPIINKRSAQVLSITGDTANVMDVETYETFDLPIPDELKGQVTEGAQVLYWVILTEKVMKQVKGAE